MVQGRGFRPQFTGTYELSGLDLADSYRIIQCSLQLQIGVQTTRLREAIRGCDYGYHSRVMEILDSASREDLPAFIGGNNCLSENHSSILHTDVFVPDLQQFPHFIQLFCENNIIFFCLLNRFQRSLRWDRSVSVRIRSSLNSSNNTRITRIEEQLEHVVQELDANEGLRRANSSFLAYHSHITQLQANKYDSRWFALALYG